MSGMVAKAKVAVGDVVVTIDNSGHYLTAVASTFCKGGLTM